VKTIPPNAERVQLDAIGFEVACWKDPRFPVMEFLAFKVISDDPRQYEDAEGQVVEDINKAAVYMSGSVKWDGCSNLTFDEQERVALHFCGKENAMHIGALLGAIYDEAARCIPGWDG
jgi:hypothetical protein